MNKQEWNEREQARPLALTLRDCVLKLDQLGYSIKIFQPEEVGMRPYVHIMKEITI